MALFIFNNVFDDERLFLIWLNYIENYITIIFFRNKKDISRIRKCRVIYSYKQDHEDELNLNKGDIVDLIGEEEEGWWRGLLDGKEGVFPSNFVEEIITDAKFKRGSKENLDSAGRELDSKTPSLPPKPGIYSFYYYIFQQKKFPYCRLNQ